MHPRTVGTSWEAHDGRKSVPPAPVTTVDIENLLAAGRSPGAARDVRADGLDPGTRTCTRSSRRTSSPGSSRRRSSASSTSAGIEIVEAPPVERPPVAPGCRRVDDGRASALPAGGRTPPAADRGAGGRPREADRARRRGREGGDDPVEPPARRLDREELPQPGPPVPRPDPGGHARADPRRREVRLAPRLQVLDVRDVVDPPGGRAGARRQGADDPDAGAHRRAAAEDQPGRALAVDAARTGADARRDRRRGVAHARSRCSRCAPPHARRRASTRRSATRTTRCSATSSPATSRCPRTPSTSSCGARRCAHALALAPRARARGRDDALRHRRRRAPDARGDRAAARPHARTRAADRARLAAPPLASPARDAGEVVGARRLVRRWLARCRR